MDSKRSSKEEKEVITLINEDLDHDEIDSTPVPLPKVHPLPPSKTEGKQSKGSSQIEDVIHSPLDQRSYKSITLPNGVKVMLISTYNVEYFPSEQDATLPPCQVPEVSQFNKKYLGYDNPAAKVKCACPCDGRKACSGGAGGKGCCGGSEGNGCCGGSGGNTCCANPGKTCCGSEAPKNETETEDFAKVNNERGSAGNANEPGSSQQSLAQNAGPKVNSLSPPPMIEDEDIRTEQERELAHNAKKIKPSLKSKSKSRFQSKTFCKACKCCEKANKSDPPAPKAEEESCNNELPPALQSKTTPTDEIPERTRRRPSLSKHYPFPPQYNEGINTTRTCPTGGGTAGSTRPKTNRPHFNPDAILDLEGTVYLVVGTGYFDDPDDQPGLAHFCEHAVFLGSEKFPEPNQLFKLVLPYDGYVNAYTSGMSTTFTTSASYKLFPLAVEILADMVGFPLFPNELVAAELEALDSEYSLRQDDTPKYFQLIGSLAKKGHVIRKMDSGNISTLRVPNYYRKLIEWRRIYYSPNRMTLALEAPFPIEYLEKLATETFGKVPVGQAIPNKIIAPGCPFDMARFHQIYHVASVHHSEFIALHWALDAKAWKNLTVKPLEYLGAIIAHKAEGGLPHYLISKGLATNVDAGCWESDVTRNHYTSVFSVSVDVTEKGFSKQDIILQAVFGYIQMLIKEGPQKSFFHELQKQQLESFHYKAAESTQSLADSVSRWMQFIPQKWCLISPTLTCQFDEDLIKKCLESLTVESANIIIFSKNYAGEEEAGAGVGGVGKEEFYNTPFSAYDFPVDLEEKLRKAKDEYSQKFRLPAPNPLLLDTSCSRSSEKDMMKKGSLVRIKGKLSVSYMSRRLQLVRGLLPQARYSIWIGSPVTSYVGAGEGSSTKLLIFSQYLNELFQTKFYHASNADLQLETEVSQGELHIIFAGAHVLLPCLMEQVLNLFNDFENVADQTGFEVVRSAFIENLDNTILDNRFLAWDLYYYLWTNNHELIFDHRRHADKLTFPNFIAFVKAFKKKMFIQAHLYGYITNAQGNIIVKSLEMLQYEPIELREYLLLRCMRQKLGERIIKVNSQNPNIHTSVVINSYQFGMLAEDEEEAINFFAKTMSDAAFYQLRTEQQLGYIIIIYAEITFGVSSIVVELVTQPKNFTTEHCNECIDNFLLDFFMENLSSEESYLEFCLGKPKLDLPFADLRNLFQIYLLPNPFYYRKLSIQVVGTTEDGQNNPAGNPQKIIQQTAYPGMDEYDSNNANNDREELPDEGGPGVQAHKAPSVGAKSTILRVRSFKRSLQVKDDFKLYSNVKSKKGEKTISSGSGAGKSGVCTRVVKDLGKFKKSLTHYPKE